LAQTLTGSNLASSPDYNTFSQLRIAAHLTTSPQDASLQPRFFTYLYLVPQDTFIQQYPTANMTARTNDHIANYLDTVFDYGSITD
jgi:hypothetical protein